MSRDLAPHGDMASCMTSNIRCPRTEACWRWLKPAAPRQAYADFEGGDDCAHYIPVSK